MRSPAGSSRAPKRGQAPAGERGFTLIEAVVAFAIMALVMGTLLGAFGGIIGGSRAARASETALALAEAKLAELGHTAPLERGERRGRFADRYAWRARVEPYRLKGPGFDEVPGLAAFRIEVEVSWTTPRGGRSLTLASLRLVPEAAR